MLFSRHYEPTPGELLYHYCDAAAFLAICTGKKMRFSDLHSMNDFMEMHWGYRIWEKAASRLIDTVGKDFLDEVDAVLHGSGLVGLPVAACFSLDGDVLSQWRAYADDGQGYSIGFDASQMLGLSVRPLRVLYSEEKQIDEVEHCVKQIYAERRSMINNGISFGAACMLLAYDLAALKNPAFREEQEVRLIHILDFEVSN